MIETILGWIILSILVAVFANSRGKSGILYFFICILLSPLLGFLIVLFSGDSTKKKCDKCGQKIDISAKVCPFCNTKISSASNEYNENKTEKGFNYKLSITEKVTFDIVKQKTLEFYKEFSFVVENDDEYTFFIKNKLDNSYIEIKNMETYMKYTVYNTVEPEFIKSLYIENDEKIDNISGVNNTDKLIELGKLYKDGLLTREEFEEQKNLLKIENLK